MTLLHTYFELAQLIKNNPMAHVFVKIHYCKGTMEYLPIDRLEFLHQIQSGQGQTALPCHCEYDLRYKDIYLHPQEINT